MVLLLKSDEEENLEEEEVEDRDDGDEEEGSFEDQLVKKLLEGVKLVVKDQETRGDTEIIKAELIEMRKDFEPDVPAEELGNVEEAIANRIDKAVEKISGLIDRSREDFKESLKQQITAFRKQVEAMGKSIARAFAEKLKLKFTERHLRKTYEDIVNKELRKRQELIVKDTLESLKPFYSTIQSNLRDVQKVLVEMRTLYRDWIEAYTSIIQEAMSESRLDYDQLMREIRSYKSKFDEMQSKIQELNAELARKEAEIERLKQQLVEQPKLEHPISQEEINKLKLIIDEKENLITELKKRNMELINTMQALITPILKETEIPTEPSPEGLREIEQKFLETIKNLNSEVKRLKDELIEKEGEIAKLRKLVETYREAEKLQEEYDELRKKYATLKGEYEAFKETFDRLKQENEALKQKLQEMHEKVLDSLSYETSKESLAELLKEKDEEIKRLQDKVIDLEKIRSEHEVLKENVALKDREIQKLKDRIKEYEELEGVLSGLRREIESYKEMLGLSVEPSSAQVEQKFSEMFEQVKKDLEMMRTEVFEKSKQIADIISENKALRSQIELKEKEIEALKESNEKLLKELEDSKVALKQKTIESEEMEKKLKEALEKLEKMEKEPLEYKKILESTAIGKIFLLVKDLKKVDIDKLAAALGISKIQLQREILKLSQLGLVKIENNTVYYIE